jgi:hypothetical protein
VLATATSCRPTWCFRCRPEPDVHEFMDADRELPAVLSTRSAATSIAARPAR